MADLREILHIVSDLNLLGAKQMGVQTTPDPSLGYIPWGGKDEVGNLTLWLAKNKPGLLTTLQLSGVTTAGIGPGFIKHDNSGNLTGGHSITPGDVPDHDDLNNISGGLPAERNHISNAELAQIHAAATKAPGDNPLTISDQQLNINIGDGLSAAGDTLANTGDLQLAFDNGSVIVAPAPVIIQNPDSPGDHAALNIKNQTDGSVLELYDNGVINTLNAVSLSLQFQGTSVLTADATSVNTKNLLIAEQGIQDNTMVAGTLRNVQVDSTGRFLPGDIIGDPADSPAAQAVLASPPVVVTIPPNTDVKLAVVDTKTIEDGVTYDLTLNRFIIQTSGRYLLYGDSTVESDTPNVILYSTLYKNGAPAGTQVPREIDNANDPVPVVGSVLLDLVAGDYIEFFNATDDSSSIDITYSRATVYMIKQSQGSSAGGGSQQLAYDGGNRIQFAAAKPLEYVENADEGPLAVAWKTSQNPASEPHSMEVRPDRFRLLGYDGGNLRTDHQMNASNTSALHSIDLNDGVDFHSFSTNINTASSSIGMSRANGNAFGVSLGSNTNINLTDGRASYLVNTGNDDISTVRLVDENNLTYEVVTNRGVTPGQNFLTHVLRATGSGLSQTRHYINTHWDFLSQYFEFQGFRAQEFFHNSGTDTTYNIRRNDVTGQEQDFSVLLGDDAGDQTTEIRARKDGADIFSFTGEQNTLAGNTRVTGALSTVAVPVAMGDNNDFDLAATNTFNAITQPTAMTINLQNPDDGASYLIRFNNISGGGVVTWPAGVIWAGGVAPVLAAGTKSMVTLYYDGSEFWGLVEETFS